MSTALSTTGGGGDNGHKGQGNHGKGASQKKRNRGRCGVCGVRGHCTHDHWRHAQGSANAGQGAPVINIATNPARWNGWRLHWPISRRPLLASSRRNAELSRLRLQEGSAEQVNEEPTAALSIADGLDAEFDINMYLDSEGEEMTKSPSQ
ncbi:hypothetical protein N7475_002695 [Penicillium sp. IBT 31633x]|nr:hypothetical protein N7475_002695 [Penicillium sp. IBT 31633x]